MNITSTVLFMAMKLHTLKAEEGISTKFFVYMSFVKYYQSFKLPNASKHVI